MQLRKYILPVVAGVLAGMILQSFGEKAIHTAYPPPAGLSFSDKAAIASYMSQVPVAAMLLQLLNYALCAVVAGVVATMFSGRVHSRPAIVAGSLITLASVANIFMLPGQPMWFSAMSVVLHVPGAMLGYALSRVSAPAVGR